MNKAVLIEELNRIGIDVISYEFGAAGYVLEIKLNKDKGASWEQLEHLPIVGLELAKNKSTGAYTRKILFIPASSKEFKDYVIKHVKYFGLGRKKAMSDLRESVNKYGTKHTIIDLEYYLKRVK